MKLQRDVKIFNVYTLQPITISGHRPWETNPTLSGPTLELAYRSHKVYWSYNKHFRQTGPSDGHYWPSVQATICKVLGKPAKIGLDPTVNLNEQQCAPQVPDTRVRRAVSLRRMGPYGSTRIDSDVRSDPSSALHSQTGLPSFIVGQFYWFKWQQLNTT